VLPCTLALADLYSAYPDMHISAGARLASFEILAHLGAGGMGTVYRAYDTNLRREVAIKILKEALAQSEGYVRRFRREARAASALNHPNIITIYEIDEFDGAPFIAMELVEGTSLRATLDRGPLPVRKLLDLGAQIADGLAAAHAHGIVHRDIKPENVMVTPAGAAKILDFGLARPAYVDADDSTAEITGVQRERIIGTAAYMSPEQARGGDVDFRSDQFSFGSLLYEMATGRRAFKRDSTADTILAIARDEPEPIRTINPGVPAPLCWIIDRCLAKERNDRYVSTTDLAQELRTLRDRLPESGSGPVRFPNVSPKRATIALGAIAMLAIAAAAGSRWINMPAKTVGQRCLAVLPFKDLSGRPDGQIFSQGFSDAVSSRLARYSALQVIPPS
jgi:serine/threonine protein kinase